jgi:predicted dehydrogenase
MSAAKGAPRAPLGVGVIGVGSMGLRHARVYARLEQCRLVALCDRDAARLEQARGFLGEVSVTTQLDELLARRDVEAVSLCLPDNAHLQAMLRCVEAGKHVLIEKPLADNYADAARIVEALRGYPKKVMVGHLLRFDPRYSGAWRMIRSGEIGEVVYARVRRTSEIRGPRYYGGAASLAFHLAVHDVDLLNWLIGSRVRRLYAAAGRKVLGELQIDDCLLSVLHFADGSLAQLEHSWIMPKMYAPRLDARIEIIGTKGVIELNLRDQGLSLYSDERAETVNTSYFYERADGGISGCLIEQIRAFLACIAEDLPVPIPVQEALEAVRVAQGLADSARGGQPVELSGE